MPIKNKVVLVIFCVLSLTMFNFKLFAEEFNISAIKVSVDKTNDIVVGEGQVEVTDSQGKVMKADKVTYEKSKEFLILEGSVEIFDTEGNILITDNATYDKMKEIINTYKNSRLDLKESYNL